MGHGSNYLEGDQLLLLSLVEQLLPIGGNEWTELGVKYNDQQAKDRVFEGQPCSGVRHYEDLKAFYFKLAGMKPETGKHIIPDAIKRAKDARVAIEAKQDSVTFDDIYDTRRERESRQTSSSSSAMITPDVQGANRRLGFVNSASPSAQPAQPEVRRKVVRERKDLKKEMKEFEAVIEECDRKTAETIAKISAEEKAKDDNIERRLSRLEDAVFAFSDKLDAIVNKKARK
jgi:hypothetical protein